MDCKKRHLIGLLLFIAIVTTDKVSADDALSLYVDNDSRLLKPNHNTDRHYTSGVKLVYLTQPDWSWLDSFSEWDAAGPEDTVDTAVGFFLGQNMYTPDYVGLPILRSNDDMRFAGWLYTGLFAQRATEHKLDHLEMNVGVIGPSSLTEQSQKCLHKLLNSTDPVGWNGQVADEFAFDLTYMRQQRLVNGWFQPTEQSDFITEYGFTAGSVHRHAQAGVMVRYGFNLGNTFAPGRLSLPSGISSLRTESLKSGYLFARAAGRAVEYNRFLGGLDTEPLVGELQVGAVYNYKQLEIGYAQTFLTHEFEEQGSSDGYGTLTLTWRF